jgi:hypothetical protein
VSLSIHAAVIWISSEFGGRPTLPVVGLRQSIRFQRNVAESLDIIWDVEISSLDVDKETWKGSAKLTFSPGASPNMDLVKEGEAIELLDGYYVIGVGKILRIEQG